jgi:hypothetical protein
MKYFDKLSREEWIEVDAAIHDAHVREDGTIRELGEAEVIFDRFVVDAVQAYRPWAGILLDGWRDEGRKKFVRDRWKNGKFFSFIDKGKKRRRSERRGTRVRHEEGHMVWIQGSLLDWTPEQLRSAIRECSNRIEEERVNISIYRSLLDLLEQTQQYTVRAALDARGVTLEEFLAARDAA